MQVLEYKEGLTKGLVHSDDNPRNTQGFTVLQGVKANHYGFVPYDTIVNPLAAWMAAQGITFAWPFPQFYRGKQLSLLMTETAVYIIDETAWTGAVPATTLDLFMCEGAYTITAGGGAWHVIDLGSPVILVNATNVLYVTATKLWGSAVAYFQCGCEHHGRVLVSGFETDTYARVQWHAIAHLINTLDTTITLSLPQTSVFWSAYGGVDIIYLLIPYLAIYGPLTLTQLVTQPAFNTNPPTAWTLSDAAMYDAANKELDFSGADTASQVLATSVSGKLYCVGYYVGNYVSGTVTASLGGTALTARSANGYYFEEVECPSNAATLLFTGSAGASLSIDNVQVYDVDASEYGLTRPFYLEHVRRRDMGILPVPWQGTQRVLKSLGSNALIYSDNGVAELIPFDAESGPTLGFKKLPNVPGIHGRAAVAGDDSVHLMVDKTGCVWRFKPGQAPERLEYEWLFSSLTDIVVTFDSTREEFYIGGKIGSTLYSYLYTASGGMSKIPQCVTSLECGGGTLRGIVSSNQFTTFKAVTGVFDMGTREPKTIREISIGLTTSAVATLVMLWYKDGVSGTWKTAAPHTLFGKGNIYCAVTGVEFKLQIDIPALTSVEIDYINVHWLPDGKISVKQILGG
ncbi:MAG: hypothetical protein IMZ62_06100 [Chloroflexi bacterium]|nr:hypothetical protein [Chloroflexota bacterium]